MKRILTAALALALMSGTVVMAQPTGPDRNGPGNNGQERLNNPGARGGQPQYRRGQRLPPQYRNNKRYVVNDWQQRHLRKPPRGYHWVRDDNNNYFLAAITTGVILDLLLNGGR